MLKGLSEAVVVTGTDSPGSSRQIGHAVDPAGERLLPGLVGRPRDPGGVTDELTDDLGHLVDFLAAAVYVDDAGLLGPGSCTGSARCARPAA